MRMKTVCFCGALALAACGEIDIASEEGAESVGGAASTLNAASDATVKEAYPTSNYGSDSFLRARSTTDGTHTIYVRFSVPESVEVGKVVLSLHALSTKGAGGGAAVVYAAAPDWDEDAVTWNSRPRVGARLGSIGPFPDGGRATLDVSEYIQQAGTYSFAIVNTSSNSLFFHSRESDSPGPQLIAGGIGGATPRATTTSTSTATPPPTVTPTSSATPPPGSSIKGILINASEIARLPTSGAAWNEIVSASNSTCADYDWTDASGNTCCLANALRYARTGDAQSKADTMRCIDQILSHKNDGFVDGVDQDKRLRLCRKLQTAPIIAELVQLSTESPTKDAAFRETISALRDRKFGSYSVYEGNTNRPNNHGLHCGAARLSVAIYLGDKATVEHTARVFKGYLGDRASWANFTYGDLAWQEPGTAPVGINAKGAKNGTHSIDGVLPDDQRRAGGFSWPPPQENYVYEGLQGALAQGIMLSRQGYDVWNWQDKALLRAFDWLHNEAAYPPTGDDVWELHVVNHFYGARYAAPTAKQAGKGLGYTDWIYGPQM